MPTLLKMATSFAKLALRREVTEEDALIACYLYEEFITSIFGNSLLGKFYLPHLRIQPPACSDHGLYGHKQRSCPPNRATKMRESQQLFFGLRLVSIIIAEFQHPAIQTEIVQYFGGFFHQIRVRQLIGRKDSIQTVIRTSRRLDLFLYEAQNFEVFSYIQS